MTVLFSMLDFIQLCSRYFSRIKHPRLNAMFPFGIVALLQACHISRLTCVCAWSVRTTRVIWSHSAVRRNFQYLTQNPPSNKQSWCQVLKNNNRKLCNFHLNLLSQIFHLHLLMLVVFLPSPASFNLTCSSSVSQPKVTAEPSLDSLRQ